MKREELGTKFSLSATKEKRGKKHPLLRHYKKEPSAMEKIADDIDAEQEEERKEEIHGRK